MGIDLHFKISKTLHIPNRINVICSYDETDNEIIYSDFFSYTSSNYFKGQDGINLEHIIKSKCGVEVEELNTVDYTWDTYIWNLYSFLSLHQNNNSVFTYIKNEAITKLASQGYNKEDYCKLFILFTFY